MHPHDGANAQVSHPVAPSPSTTLRSHPSSLAQDEWDMPHATSQVLLPGATTCGPSHSPPIERTRFVEIEFLRRQGISLSMVGADRSHATLRGRGSGVSIGKPGEPNLGKEDSCTMTTMATVRFELRRSPSGVPRRSPFGRLASSSAFTGGENTLRAETDNKSCNVHVSP